MKNKSLSFLKTIAGLVLTLIFVFGSLGFISTNKANAATVSVASQSANVGQTISIPVIANGITLPVSGLTLAGIHYDNTKLDFTGYTVGSIPITSNDKYVANDAINISWYDPGNSPVRVSDRPVLITLNFLVLTAQSTSTTISFGGNLDVSDENGMSIPNVTFVDGVIDLNRPLTPPNPPTLVTAFAGNRFASVQFRAATTTGSSTIVRYTVTSYPGNISVNGVSSPILVTGLANGNSYTFRVTATDANGNTSEPSAESNVVRPTDSNRIPGVPTNLTATPGNGQVALTWSAPANNEELPFGAVYTSNIFTAILSYFRSTPLITDYIVEYKVTGATTTWIRYNDGVSTNQSAMVTGLNNGTSYSFIVSAEVNGSAGSASNIAYATPRDLNTRPVVTVIAVPNPIASGSSANIIWSSTNSSSCGVTRMGTSTVIANGSSTGQVSTGPLTSNTVYTVTCLGRDGLPPGTASVTVNVARASGGGGTGNIRQLVPETELIETPVNSVPAQNQELKQVAPQPEVLYKNKDSLSATILNSVLRLLGI